MLSRQDVVKNFTLNVEKERLRQQFTQEQMAKRLGLSLSGYKKMISGATAKIDLYMALQLHDMSGKWIFELVGREEADIEFLMKIRRLTAYQKRLLHGILDFELSCADTLPEDAEDYITVFVPSDDPSDGMLCDPFNWFKVNAASYRKKFGDSLYCGIQIVSDQFAPVYRLGDILLLCRRSVREGDAAVFYNQENGRLYLRKATSARSWMLEPVNGLGEAFLINSLDQDAAKRWIQLGCVLDKIRE